MVESGELEVEIQSTGQRIVVSRTESLCDALANAGIEIATSCQSGLCGTCKTRYIRKWIHLSVDRFDYSAIPFQRWARLLRCASA